MDMQPSSVLEDGLGGVRELGFGPLVLQGKERPSWLRLVNVLPHQLAALSISDGKDGCFELSTRLDRMGRSTTAGDLLLAMARMDGWNALVVDLRGLRCVNAATRVRCRVVKLPLALAGHCGLQVSCF
jgi:hypothetical protein